MNRDLYPKRSARIRALKVKSVYVTGGIAALFVILAIFGIILKNQPNHSANSNGTSKVVKEYKDKLPALKQAVEKEPANANRHFDYAVALYATGNLEEAKAQYETASKLNSKDPVLRNNLGNVYRDLKQYDKAVSSYRVAIKLNPSYRSAYINLASIQENQQSNRSNAIKTYQQSLVALPDDSQLSLLLALTYERNGNISAARQTLKNLLEEAPNDSAAKAQLDRLNDNDNKGY